MEQSTTEFAAQTRRLVITQITLGGFCAAGFYLAKGAIGAQSAIYGTAISIVLAVLLITGVRRAAASAEKSKNKSMAVLYFGAAQRFLLALVLFALGVGKLGLDPLAMVAGFAVAQATYLLAMQLKRSVNDEKI